MKNILPVLIMALTMSTSAMAGMTLKSSGGSFQETYRTVESHGIKFNCLVIESASPEWLIRSDEVESGQLIMRSITRDMKVRIEAQKKQNRNFCKQYEVLSDSSLASERAILNRLSENLASRLVSASGGMDVQGMARSYDPGLSTCINDLVNVVQLNQIEKACL